jgi:hypothetical protein
MKKLTPKKMTVILIILLISLPKCESLIDQNDDCDKTKFAKTEEPVFSLIVDADQTLTVDDGTKYDTKDATKAIVSGSITKIYCSGSEGGRFEFNTTLFPSASDLDFLNKAKIGNAYQIKFANENDYVIVIFREKYYFSDGKIFESVEISQRIYFKNIFIDTSLSDFPKFAWLNDTKVSFHEVTI